MNIKAITDYLDTINISKRSLHIRSIERGDGSSKQMDIVRSKYDAFKTCILQWCMTNGANTAQALIVYQEEIERQQKEYRRHKEMFKSMLEARGIQLKPLVSSPFEEQALIDVTISDNDYKVFSDIKNYNNAMLLHLSDAIRFIDKMINVYCPSAVTSVTRGAVVHEPDDVYYTTSFSDKTLKKVFDYLIKRGCLHPETLLSDFIYYFTGRGEKAKDGLKWEGKDAKKVRLAYFINTIIKGGRDQDKSYWKKAEIIFAVKGLANSYSMSNSNNDNTSNEQFVEDIEKLLK